MHLQANWTPTDETIKKSNIYGMMQRHNFTNYNDFWKWSAENKEQFWKETIENLEIKMAKPYNTILDISNGVEQAKWLFGAELNIVDSCFQDDNEAIAVTYQKEGGTIQKVSQKELEILVNRIANSFLDYNVFIGDTIAINMPMTYESVAIYLAAIKAGIIVATIADSFTVNEIAVRLKITNPKLVFTQDYLERAGKKLPLYSKVVDSGAKKVVVIPIEKNTSIKRNSDVYWDDFLSEKEIFESVKLTPEATITILFSSGTTGEPKAIPWNHTTPIKSASDGYYHQDIHKNDVVCWPTNLGWMMGPWLVFATLINKATIALYYDAPLSAEFGLFVEKTKVTMLGVIPSIVKHWKNTKYMEPYDWSNINCFSSTGEVSNPIEMQYLMNLAGNKPVIEYCGGTEIGGGYVASTVVQPNIASAFSTQTLGGCFALLDDENIESDRGELFLIPPIMGLSITLLNKDHQKVYYDDTPKYKSKLRRHGDELCILENGYYKTLGRVDDAMNLGGIKVSATQIELIINKLSFVKESAAIAISPGGGGPSLLVVFYVKKNRKQLNENYLLQAQQLVRAELNPLFKVSELVEIERLPRTASNKVMRRKLRDEYGK